MRLVKMLAGALVGLGLAAGGAGAATFGLVVGAGDYGNRFLDLDGAVPDARDIARALRTLDPVRVVTLVDAEATRAAVVAAWRGILAEARPGDLVVFSYAGHGGQMPERHPDNEADGRDELLILPGFAWNPGGGRPLNDQFIVDDELNAWFLDASDRGISVIFVADACHSGTLDRRWDRRAGRPGVRSVPLRITAADVAAAALPAVPDRPDTGRVPDLLLMVAAAPEHRTVTEVPIDGQRRGALSYAVARALEGEADADRNGTVTRFELENHVVETVRAYAEARQTPVFRPVAAPDRAVLTLPQAAAAAAPAARRPARPWSRPPAIRLAVVGAAPGLPLDGVEPVQDRAEADLVWDPANRTAVSGQGDVVSRAATAAALPGIVAKHRAVAGLRALVRGAGGLSLRLAPDDGAHREGDYLRLSITNLGHPYLTLFSLSAEGTVFFLYPTKPTDTHRIRTDHPFALPFKAIAPFGAEHIVAITTATPVTGLHRGLAGLDQSRRSLEAAALVADTVAAAPAALGLQPLFIEP